MDLGSVRVLGLAVVGVLATPLVLLVAIPAVTTFLGWLVGVPAAFLAEVVPLGRRHRDG